MPARDEQWMQHALHLSVLAKGNTAPNPMVGAVLVYKGRIIGEGWHHEYGQAHAEVNCIRSVKEADRSFIEESTMYVTLEPCNHYGKTPPCADLLVQKKVKRVVIACKDTFSKVNGEGIIKLKNAGCEVHTGLFEKEARWINRRFFTFFEKHRPYIILKWAETADGKMGTGTAERLLISNPLTNRWVHKLRAENQSILVGATTVNKDDPRLDTRLYADQNPPVKIILDRNGKVLPASTLFQEGNRSIVFTGNPMLKNQFAGNTNVQVVLLDSTVPDLLQWMGEHTVQSVLVEGGNQVLQEFIAAGCWDEAFVIRGEGTFEEEGLLAPRLTQAILHRNFKLGQDNIAHFVNKNNAYYL